MWKYNLIIPITNLSEAFFYKPVIKIKITICSTEEHCRYKVIIFHIIDIFKKLVF